LGSYIAKHVAGKYGAKSVLKAAFGWMLAMVLLNIVICYALPAKPLWNILPIALFNMGMALAMPILSLAALDRHPKIRGTAASGQAFVQMALSTISAGAIVPLVWGSVAGLAWVMAAYLLLGLWVISTTKLFKQIA